MPNKSNARGADCKYRKCVGLGEYSSAKNDKSDIDVLNRNFSNYSQKKYSYFLNAPFDISHKCCYVMKKSPAHSYQRKTKRHAITAQMATESRLRTEQWLKNGCNGFDMKTPISNPMSFWTEQDVLLYIYVHNAEMIEKRIRSIERKHDAPLEEIINSKTGEPRYKRDEITPIAFVYGNIVEINGKEISATNLDSMELFDLDRPCLKTTGCERTGCMFCGFGCHLEKQGEGRFLRLKETHHKQYNYIMKSKEEHGLGFKEVIDWINEHGGLDIEY